MNPIITMCFYVASVVSNGSLGNVENEKFTFGVKQMTEDLLLERGTLMCDPTMIKSAQPVTVVITESPSEPQSYMPQPSLPHPELISAVTVTFPGEETFNC